MSCHKASKLVAIVDDDDSVRGTLQELLRSAGFSSRAFDSAEGFLPTIFITAHGDEEMRFKALREGAVEFLQKPFDDEVLIESIRAALNR